MKPSGKEWCCTTVTLKNPGMVDIAKAFHKQTERKRKTLTHLWEDLPRD